MHITASALLLGYGKMVILERGNARCEKNDSLFEFLCLSLFIFACYCLEMVAFIITDDDAIKISKRF